jgi:putative transcriptional regulator
MKSLSEVIILSVSYKKLWKLLIDREMKKKDLCAKARISHASMAKLGKNENVTTDVLVRICSALNCDIGDIMEIVNDSNIAE